MGSQNSIENRISGVDLNSPTINSAYRGALHQKLSQHEVPLKTIRDQLGHDIYQPLDAETARIIHQIRSFIWDTFQRDIIQLSPVGIAGIDHHITKSSPLKIAHVASKAADVVADPTVQLATEVWRRRIARDQSDIQLGAFHRCLRLQKYQSTSLKPTFEMFGTYDSSVSKNKKELDHDFLGLIEAYIHLLQHFLPGEQFEVCISHIGIAAHILRMNNIVDDSSEDETSVSDKAEIISQHFDENVRGSIDGSWVGTPEFMEYCQQLEFRRQAIVIQSLVSKLINKNYRNVRVTARLDRSQGIGHYSGTTFMILHNGVDLVDGGEVDWVAKLSSNKKEKGIVSGCGTELLARLILELNTQTL